MKGLRGHGALAALSTGDGRPQRSKRSRPVERSASALADVQPHVAARAIGAPMSSSLDMKPTHSCHLRPRKAFRLDQVTPGDIAANKTTTSPSDADSGDVEVSEQGSPADSVSCPVCGRRMSPEVVNEHLDVCLASGSLGRQTVQQTIRFGRTAPTVGRVGASPGHPSTATTGTSQAVHSNPGSEPPQSREHSQGPSAISHVPAPGSEVRGALPAPVPTHRPSSRRRPSLPREVHGWATSRALVVGRRFHRDVEPGMEGELLEVVREPTNARDPNAIQVVRRSDSATTETLGHLPASVAACLAGLLDVGAVEAKAVMGAVAEGANANAPLPVVLCFCRRMADGDDDEDPDRPEDAPEDPTKMSMDKLKSSIAEAMAEVQAKSGGVGVAPESLQSNMQSIINTVLGLEGLVLSTEEIALLSSFQQLPLPAQYLFLRLYLRKGSLFKVQSIAYAEVPNLEAAIKELEAKNILKLLEHEQLSDNLAEIALPDILQVLTVPEMQSIATAIGVSTSGPRQDLLRRLCDAGLPARTPWRKSAPSGEDLLPPDETRARTLRVMAAVVASVGALLYIPSDTASAFARAQRFFFQSEGQDVNSFLLSDLGAIKYPECNLESSKRPVLFASRDDMLDYEEALAQARTLSQAVEAGDATAAEEAFQPAKKALQAGQHKVLNGLECSLERSPPLQGRFRAGWVYSCMGTVGVSVLEKLKRHTEAVEMLRILLGGVCCPGRRGEWWLRLSIDLEHLGRHDEALEAAETALADEWVRTGDRTSLQRRVLRLGKPPRRWRQPAWASPSAPPCAALWEPKEVVIQGRPIHRSTGVKSAFWGFDGDQTTVEGLALQHYAQEDIGEWKGMHSEGGVWSVMFSLLLWEVLFDGSVPGAFVHSFHSAPLDLGTDSFWLRRRDAIEAVLRLVEEGQGPAMLQHRWAQSCGRQCRGVNWGRTSLDVLVEIAECMGGPAVASICRLKAQDYGNWSAGMPDLVLWRPEHKDAKLVEVKGPRDRLSDQQRSWCCALTAAGVQVEVCKIVEPQQCTKPGKRRKSAGCLH